MTAGERNGLEPEDEKSCIKESVLCFRISASIASRSAFDATGVPDLSKLVDRSFLSCSGVVYCNVGLLPGDEVELESLSDVSLDSVDFKDCPGVGS